MQFTRRTLIVGAAAFAAVPALASCSKTGTAGGGSSASGPRILTIGSNMDNNSFDPTQINIGNQSQYWGPVFDTLLTRDKDFKLVANMASKWSYNDSRTEMAISLVPGITFSDGTALTADVVMENWKNLAGGTGQNAYMTKSIKEIKKTSDTEFTVVLSAPDPGFEEYLASVGGAMASPKSFKAADVAKSPIGSGPYTLDAANTVVGSQYTYLRNPNYWNKSFPAYDKVIIKVMTDTTARLNALKSGQINAGIAELKSVDEAKASKLQVGYVDLNWVGLLLMDRDGKTVPQLKDLRVRQAINYCFDQASILKSIDYNQGAITTQIFGTGTVAYDKGLDNKYLFDLDKAKSLMAEAGASAGFTVSMPRSPGGSDAYYAVVESSLGKINIKVNWNQVPIASIIAETISGKYPVTFMTLGSQSAWQDIQKAVLGAWNPYKCADPALTALLDKAKKASQDDAPAAFKAISTWLVDNAWFAPWYRVQTPYLTDAKTDVYMDKYVVVPPIRNFSTKA